VQPKILILDIETSPKVAYVWRFWQENVGAKQVLQHSHIMSFACKWLDSPDIYYEENRKENDYSIIKSLCEYLDNADIVIAHNGDKFDIPQIRSRALFHNIPPPSPVVVIDTYKTAKREFGFPSNSLEYLTLVLGCKVKKGGHKKFPGFELWLECLRNNDEAWDEMRTYNIEDVLALEELYYKMRPWMPNHPNLGVYADPDKPICPKCGSFNVQRRGFSYTAARVYHRFQCKDCGGWGRTRYALNVKNDNVLGNAVQ